MFLRIDTDRKLSRKWIGRVGKERTQQVRMLGGKTLDGLFPFLKENGFYFLPVGSLHRVVLLFRVYCKVRNILWVYIYCETSTLI